MKTFKNCIISALLIFSITACQDMLDVNPKGVLTEDQLQDPEQLDGFVTAAYAFMPRSHAFETYNPFIASLRSDDAYKGGGGLNDQTPWYQMEVFSLVNASIGNNDNAWYRAYQGISRVNTAIRAIENVSEEDYPVKQERLAEMRFLRGWIHFKMKRRWKWIPYIDETATVDDIPLISNHPDDMQNDLPLWQKILDDFKFAAEHLPPEQDEVGRANQYAAKAYAAQVLLWMAYPQDNTHQVTGIDTEKLSEALVLVNDIIDSGAFSLASDFAQNFMLEYDNASPESLWELQFTIDDGTPRGNLNEGNGLTAPWWNPYFSCCDFHKASYNLVNAFQVGDDGLPLFDGFNESELKGNYDEYFSRSFDPRLGHTVAIPDFPWKYQEIVFDSTGSRDPGIYGYMNSLKENVRTDSPGLWDEFWMFNSKNQIEVRYAEVLLWKAEILIRLGRQDEALPVINQLRERAANSTEKLKLPDGTFPAEYKVEPYVNGVNINWNAETAWKALVWENRLEMAMEGRRFYDLVRWGIAAEVMNAYFEKESQRYPWMEVAYFTKGRDEYLPIPQAQMNWSKGVYKQNPGY
ncbi:RagB/SusD family nutrient uptake outer membrane protein [Sinomicrobium weinanense]|uniref:RagB/SusD family nutrient uptake outer membrane protein n=1 Tax=Sinomicrobium weinanense TaxID=2842200 RepID=A0A926JQX1_9FLAO|nr:RagB/SusD family nutrient uptake outer membrane protein [Sinomicrobium weinanense]MBC9795721.1 RagB/SusD family nutrient uptake outer membrane protein [Sinomicrobium weinanense]MBU3125284.1 RagB/SusD family nutrient uptake outer membrane protein [Sinomicrobium weinanense]